MELFECIEKRRSIRFYEDRPVEKEKLDRIMGAMRLAPSAKNLQPYVFYIATSKEMKEKLAGCCTSPKNRDNIGKAGAIIAAAADPEKAYESADKFNTFVLDCGIAIEHASLAATALGLGSLWIRAFEEEKVRQALGVGTRVVALMPIGYAAESPDARDRKSPGELFKEI